MVRRERLRRVAAVLAGELTAWGFLVSVAQSRSGSCYVSAVVPAARSRGRWLRRAYTVRISTHFLPKRRLKCRHGLRQWIWGRDGASEWSSIRAFFGARAPGVFDAGRLLSTQPFDAHTPPSPELTTLQPLPDNQPLSPGREVRQMNPGGFNPRGRAAAAVA